MTFAFLFLLDQISVTRAAPRQRRFPFPSPHIFLQIIQRAKLSQRRPRSAWPRLPHLIQRCPGSESTLSCPWVHFHCLETRPASSSSGERQLCLRGRGAACINCLFLQVRDKEQQRRANYHSLYVQTSGKDCWWRSCPHCHSHTHWVRSDRMRRRFIINRTRLSMCDFGHFVFTLFLAISMPLSIMIPAATWIITLIK